MKLKYNFVFNETCGIKFAAAPDCTQILQNNETATTILQLLSKDTTIDAVVDEMCNEYDAPREVIERDAVNFINLLREKDLIID